MVELETEVCLAAIQLYLEKPEEKRTKKHKKLVMESMQILAKKQNQFTARDEALYKKALVELM